MATEMSPGLSSLLTRVQPAGVILFARNIISAQQTYQLLKDCQACVATPLFTCVDLEGGRVDRLRNVIGPAPSAGRCLCHRDAATFSQAWQSHRQNLPRPGIQHGLGSGAWIWRFEASRR